MYKPFKEYHLFQLLGQLEKQPTSALDYLIKKYFHSHKSLGPKDRKWIGEQLYGMVRWLSLLDHFCAKPANWEQRHRIFQRLNPLQHLEDSSIPLHARVGFPSFLFDKLVAAYGEEKAKSLCLSSNDLAPTTIRVNGLKIARDALLERFQKSGMQVEPTKFSPLGIVFANKLPLFSLPEFKEGLFEMQDEASQLAADLIDAKPGEHVLDFCAGSGGKSLAFAQKMQQKGQIYLHDTRVLLKAKVRLRRAGIQNIQFLSTETLEKGPYKQRMNWVILDVPCSGSGTLRRNPEIKWKFDQQSLEHLIKTQREIFAQAIRFLRPGGKIVYMTCSLLPEENEQQIEFFCKEYSLQLHSEPFRAFPARGGMDGFFAAVLNTIC